MTGTLRYDVVVVGAGNAGLCAALAAREQGAKVLVVECAPVSERGGNTAFTAGAMRVAYNGVEDLLELVPDLTDEEKANTDFRAYPEDEFFDDMARVTEYRADPDLVEVLVGRSFETLRWMRGKGIRFIPIYGRQAFNLDGKFTFWGGLTIEVAGGGLGLVNTLFSAGDREGVDVLYDSRALSLVCNDEGVNGVSVRHRGETVHIAAAAVILATGGFEANSEWRARYLGPGWDLARVRGTRFNTGDGIRMALQIGASSYGHWSGCHAVAWDQNAPEFGDLRVGDGFQKHSYPFGVMVNTEGHRFVDEGADFRTYTYAKYGRIILQQPQQVAWQIFDQKVAHLLRDEYRISEVTRARANSLEEVAEKMDGVDTKQLLKTIHEYNSAVMTDVSFNPNIRDGRGTRGLEIPKSNWANLIDEPPFEAYAVTCGITFTFGGLRVTKDAEVMNSDGAVIPGLYAAGELIGGLFYFNYPGGTGLTSGAVFGRIAGTAAANALATGRS